MAGFVYIVRILVFSRSRASLYHIDFLWYCTHYPGWIGNDDDGGGNLHTYDCVFMKVEMFV